MKDLSTWIHFLVHLSLQHIKDYHVLDDTIPAETTVAPDSLKGAEQTLLDEMKPFWCVLPFDLEEVVGQIGSYEALEVKNLSIWFW